MVAPGLVPCSPPARDQTSTKGARYAVEKGLAGGDPGSPPTYVAMGYLYCDSMGSFQAGFGPHAQEVLGDVPNYTDAKVVIQISEVVVE